MESSFATIQQLVSSLHQAHSTKFSGRLISSIQKSQSEPWFFDFREGHLVWINHPHHRNRRWLRILRQQCPTFFKEHWSEAFTQLKSRGEFIGEYWEVTLLDQCYQNGLLSPEKIQLILQTYLIEALTGLSSAGHITQQWIDKGNTPKILVKPLLQNAIRVVQKSQQQWKILGHKYAASDLLQQFSLDLAPVITEYEALQAKVDPLVFGQLSKLLTGHHTLWDIASILQQDWISVTSVLLPLINAKSIALKPTGDIKLEVDSKAPVLRSASLKTKSRGVIACIDDSPVIAKELERMLHPYGFEVMSITDPLKGLTTLMTAKPRLIFLDLVMPNTNGYEMCTFLRKSAQFKTLPIVMLTGHDGIVDRLRAKMAGSTDFLSKPPDITKVLQVLEKQLNEDLLTVAKTKKKTRLQELPA